MSLSILRNGSVISFACFFHVLEHMAPMSETDSYMIAQRMAQSDRFFRLLSFVRAYASTHINQGEQLFRETQFSFPTGMVMAVWTCPEVVGTRLLQRVI